MRLTTARQWGRRGLYLLPAALVLMVVLSPGRARAVDLNVDTTLGNSPYAIPPNPSSFTNENIGTVAGGEIDQSGVTTNTATGNLTLGVPAAVTGTYNLSGGTLSVTGSETIGNSGTGAFTQTGGTNTVAQTLTLGDQSGASGSYTLGPGGSLAVGGDEYIGNFGSGAFTQTGGTNTTTGTLILGNNSGPTGTYNLSGGSLSALSEFFGNPGTGTFTQSGGTNTVINNLYLGYFNAASSGTYNLSGGSLSADFEAIGVNGTGAFIQTGGTHTVSDILILGDSPGASGTYNLSGTGSLSVTGAGGETIGNSGTGTFTQTGGTNTVAQTLTLGDQSGASGSYTLSNTGSLSVSGDEFIGSAGSGTFTQTGGTNAVSGDLNVGTGAGKGTYALLGGSATVGGSYTQGANGTFAVGIPSATTFEKLMVTGDVLLNGTVAPILQGGYIPTVGTLLHGVITAGGSVSGTFSSVATMFWEAVYTPTTFDLLYAGNFTGAGVRGVDLTHNQLNVANMLNAVAGSAHGDLANVIDTIVDLPNNGAVANAYQQISPDKVASLSTLAFAGANMQKSTLSRRITDIRFGPEDASLSAGGLGSSLADYVHGEGLMVASSASSLTGLLTGQKEPNALEKPWGIYFDPGLIFGNQASTVDQTGFGFTMAGFTAGADYRVWQDLLVGLNTGYTYTGAGFRGSGGYVQGNTWPLNAYAAYLPKPFYAYGSLGYALNLYNLERDFNFGGLSRAATSSPTGNQLNAYGETGYDIKVNPVVLTPAVTLSYSKLWIGGFTESGAGALDLTVGPENAQSLQTGVGGKVAVPMQRNSVTVTPQAYAFYQHEFSDSSRIIDARLSQGGGAFNYLTDDFSGQPHRNFAVLGADVTIATKNNLKVQLDYNAEVGRGNYTAHYVSAGVRWQF
ncbi:MAG: autotransporter domain-containing protein [Desulfobaccales bacterium]